MFVISGAIGRLMSTLLQRGPFLALSTRRPMSMHSKALANLKYTTADVDYWDDYWRNGDWSRRPSYETHATLRDADYAALNSHLAEVEEWFADSSKIRGFDGGSIVFCFSGHGREGDGALCLNNDTYFDAEDFIRFADGLQLAIPGALDRPPVMPWSLP